MNKMLKAEDLDMWHSRLCKSLKLTYTTRHGGPPKWGDRVTAHPEFDPAVEAAMDAALGKQVGTAVYKRAFQACKPRAQRMLDWFERMQVATNRPFFRNALRRAAVYCPPETIALLARPLSSFRPKVHVEHI